MVHCVYVEVPVWQASGLRRPRLCEGKINRMWADVQCDGRPAEHRWRSLRKFIIPLRAPRCEVWPMPTNRVLCSKAVNTGEFCTMQNSGANLTLRPSLALSYIDSVTAQHSIISRRQPNFAALSRGVTYIRRAAITLRIGPHSSSLWPPCVADADIIFSSCGFFCLLLSSFFFYFPRLVSAIGDWMSTILPHVVWS